LHPVTFTQAGRFDPPTLRKEREGWGTLGVEHEGGETADFSTPRLRAPVEMTKRSWWITEI
jgi:hypothetical protein